MRNQDCLIEMHLVSLFPSMMHKATFQLSSMMPTYRCIGKPGCAKQDERLNNIIVDIVEPPAPGNLNLYEKRIMANI